MSRKFIGHFVDPKGIYVADNRLLGLLAAGTTVPTDGTAGYEPGCIFLDIDAAISAQFFINTGTSASCAFKAVAGTDLSGLLATAAEINRTSQVSTRVVDTTATLLSVTLAAHDSKVVTISSTSPIAITLPAATGTGAKFTFVVNIAATATSHTIKVVNTLDKMKGSSRLGTTTTDQVNGFLTTATDDTITLNGTTLGGVIGDRIEIIDIASTVFAVSINGFATGTVATPFSATV